MELKHKLNIENENIRSDEISTIQLMYENKRLLDQANSQYKDLQDTDAMLDQQFETI